ncbi:hypothetical protein JW979_09145 [bacterium]|nr:hypothetical protein [candidate division CSSED10-310 bacterium]
MKRLILVTIMCSAVWFSLYFESAGICETQKQNKNLSRNCYMGFTTWPYDVTTDAVLDTYQKIRDHGDIIAVHWDEGIPWPEAYDQRSYPYDLEYTLQFMQNQIGTDETVYLGISALNMSRNGMALYRGNSPNQPLPSPWSTYAFDDEHVITAYTNFCLDLIARFNPAYVNYSIEASELLFASPEKWNEFTVFMQEVSTRIKYEHPSLPLCLSIALKHPDSSEMLFLADRLREMLPYIDFLGGSVYPYIFYGLESGGDPAQLPLDWLYQLEELAQGKPTAITETGWIAEDLVIDSLGVSIAGTPEWQASYIDRLMWESDQMEMLFVIWFTIVDYDALWDTLPESMKELALIWRDTGLYSSGSPPQPRIALNNWDQWLMRLKTPSKPCIRTGVNVIMPSTFFHPNDTAALTIYVCNDLESPIKNHPLFLILDIYGNYYYAPSFSGIDYYNHSYESGHNVIEVVPEFYWPFGTGHYENINWYCALLTPAMNAIYGEYDIFRFGWTE